MYNVRFICIISHHCDSWLRHVPNSTLLLHISKLFLEVSTLKLTVCAVRGSKARVLNGKLLKLAEKFLLESFHRKLSLSAMRPKTNFLSWWEDICSSHLPLCTSSEQTCWRGLFTRQRTEGALSLQLCPSHRISSAPAK